MRWPLTRMNRLGNGKCLRISGGSGETRLESGFMSMTSDQSLEGNDFRFAKCAMDGDRNAPAGATPPTRIFHQDAELWRRTGRDRSGSTGVANRSFYWQDGHARYGRPEPVRIRVTPNPTWVQTKRPWIGCTDAPASKRGWPGEISGLGLCRRSLQRTAHHHVRGEGKVVVARMFGRGVIPRS